MFPDQMTVRLVFVHIIAQLLRTVRKNRSTYFYTSAAAVLEKIRSSHSQSVRKNLENSSTALFYNLRNHFPSNPYINVAFEDKTAKDDAQIFREIPVRCDLYFLC